MLCARRCKHLAMLGMPETSAQPGVCESRMHNKRVCFIFGVRLHICSR